MSTEHDRTVRTEFRRQTPTFEGENSFFADPRLARWVARHLDPLGPSELVLEVACGAAHQGEAIFDLTFCCFAVHHFAHPRGQLAEMVRVSRPGGRIAVIDLVSADPELADVYNDVERRRDPSHTRALTADELQRAVERAGAAVEHTTRVDVRVPVERWLAQASTPDDVADAIRGELTATEERSQQPALRSVGYGSIRCPLAPPSRISKCRWGPVASPV